jgi:hypothetical protein
VRPDFHPDFFGFDTAERQRRVSDADNEGITARPGLRNDFDVFATAEAEFQQAASEGREALGSGAHADDHPFASG